VHIPAAKQIDAMLTGSLERQGGSVKYLLKANASPLV
jgi:hypothetical protein